MKNGSKPDGKRTQQGHYRRAKHGSPRRPTRAQWRALNTRLARLTALTRQHPELAAVAVGTTKLMSDRYTALLALADKWSARAVALGFMSKDEAELGANGAVTATANAEKP
jgi:hypothetical protein